MKKIVLMPDSFKGTMSAEAVCSIMQRIVQEHVPDIEIVSIPIADGGDGCAQCFKKMLNGKEQWTTVKNPYMEEMQCCYTLLENHTAVIEMASCAGIMLVEDRKNPCKTTTYGVGQLMVHAANAGCTRIFVGLGGSCTNDAGTGAAAAAGIRFQNKNGEVFLPTGETLGEIAHIDTSGLCPALKAATIIAMCDTDNPFCGENGAAYVFGPQKGADAPMVRFLDGQLQKVADRIYADVGLEVRSERFAGAAGGMGGGMKAFFRADLCSGIDTILDVVQFDELVSGADLVFSGEGRLDAQSIKGKAIAGIARRLKKKEIPLIVVAGDVTDDIGALYDMGVTAVFSINREARSFDLVKIRKEDLTFAMHNILRLIAAIISR